MRARIPRVRRLAATTTLLAGGLVVFAQVGYPLTLALRERLRGRDDDAGATPVPADDDLPSVTLVVAAHREAEVIGDKVRNALALDYPRDRLEVVVSCDGSPDDTPRLAREAGADVVLENPRGGKIRAQDAAVARSRADVVAFSDANAMWEPGALRRLAAAFADPSVGYACGRVTFLAADGGTNQEGAYWRYEMWLRAMESRLHSVTAGNGAIYATRRAAYVVVDPVMGHDLTFPFTFVQSGWRAVDVEDARATERMVPSIEGESARKRRMMSHAWAIVLRGGLLRLDRYPAAYAYAIVGHRVLRYASPFLHLAALAANVAWVADGRRAPAPRAARTALAAQIALLAAASAGSRVPARPLLIARYYVLTTASIALGLADHLRHGTEAGWSPPEGTR